MGKRKYISLHEQIEAIKLLESGYSSRKVAEKFGVGRSQIQETFKRKAEYMSDYDMNVNPERKRQKTSVNAIKQVNDLDLGFINDANSRKISLSRQLIQERARKYASELGLTEFKATNGWLENNLVFKKMSGECGDVDLKTVNDWKDKILSICEGYHPRDIFNMDETGIFFKDGRKTTFVQAGTDCAGGKRGKNQITVALCASMMGEKFTPLVIGKSAKPRYFSKVKVDVKGSELLTQVTVLDTIFWISCAWKKLNVVTIIKCFNNCGFEQLRIEQTQEDDDTDDECVDDNIPLAFLARTVDIYGQNINELILSHKDLPVCDPEVTDWDLPATELLKKRQDDEVSADESAVEETVVPVCTLIDVSQYLEKLKHFACQQGNYEFLSGVMDLSVIASQMQSEVKCKQQKITD